MPLIACYLLTTHRAQRSRSPEGCKARRLKGRSRKWSVRWKISRQSTARFILHESGWKTTQETQFNGLTLLGNIQASASITALAERLESLSRLTRTTVSYFELRQGSMFTRAKSITRTNW
jgi:hypothetical protein